MVMMMRIQALRYNFSDIQRIIPSYKQQYIPPYN